MVSGWLVSKRVPVLLALVSFSAFGQQTVEVVILDYRYQPPEARIKTGDTVSWINREKRTSHSILFAAESGQIGLESERLFPGERWQRRFDKAGRYTYSCGPHPEMSGVVEVNE